MDVLERKRQKLSFVYSKYLILEFTSVGKKLLNNSYKIKGQLAKIWSQQRQWAHWQKRLLKSRL